MIKALSNANTPLTDGIYLIGISILTPDGRFLEQHVGEVEVVNHTKEEDGPIIPTYVDQILVDSTVNWKLDFITQLKQY